MKLRIEKRIKIKWAPLEPTLWPIIPDILAKETDRRELGGQAREKADLVQVTN